MICSALDHTAPVTEEIFYISEEHLAKEHATVRNLMLQSLQRMVARAGETDCQLEAEGAKPSYRAERMAQTLMVMTEYTCRYHAVMRGWAQRAKIIEIP